jgi:hypothetical protein
LSVPIGVTFSIEEPLHYFRHRGRAIVHQLEDPASHPARGACPDPVLLAGGERPGQALGEHRTHVAQLGGSSHLLDAHGGLLGIVAEVVSDPYSAAVRSCLPGGVEVVDGVGDPALGVELRGISVDPGQEGVESLMGLFLGLRE